MASGRYREDACSVIQRRRSRMRYTPKNSGVTAPPPLWLLDRVRDRLQVRHSLRTEQASLSWIRRFILASGKRCPVQMGQAEVEACLTRLATDAQVSVGTQNQALAALLFLYREVVRIDRHRVSDELPKEGLNNPSNL
ncbi:site-specific recombinase [Xanthomonas bromi]|uniref:Site-specific recombinase n=2 Tax=Xanthomonas bromi TaxID=56449 RepID=A0A1C3NRW7_9XANT|nr:site-specific recombinase [Xanthomonas bromi]